MTEKEERNAFGSFARFPFYSFSVPAPGYTERRNNTDTDNNEYNKIDNN
jgi:hypothetical protein